MTTETALTLDDAYVVLIKETAIAMYGGKVFPVPRQLPEGWQSITMHGDGFGDHERHRLVQAPDGTLWDWWYVYRYDADWCDAGVRGPITPEECRDGWGIEVLPTPGVTPVPTLSWHDLAHGGATGLKYPI